jgi:hypothetical protein
VVYDDAAPNTTCPPRRAFVASDACRRGQVCLAVGTNTIAFGGVLTTSAMLASVDNTRSFSSIVAVRAHASERLHGISGDYDH